VVSQKATKIRGHPPFLLSDEEIERKFLGCVLPVLGSERAKLLLDSLRQIETAPTVRDVFSLLQREL
jgi:hypothetical protein